MLRLSIALAATVLSLASVSAQEAPALPDPTAQAPSPASANAAPGGTTIDPMAGTGNGVNPANVLTGLYYTRAVIDICDITIAEDVALKMRADEVIYSGKMGLDAGSAEAGYTSIRKSVEQTKPDCADASVDRKAVEEVVTTYAAQ